MTRVLVPVGRQPAPRSAITYAARAAVMSHADHVELTLLRVGGEDTWPDVDPPALKTCSWEKLRRDGDVVDEILRTARERKADLIVMATEGTTGVLDALRGSTTEQVLRGAQCPVLAVPAGRT